MAEEEGKSATPMIYLKVSSIPADLDKKISKTEKSCKICAIPFDKKAMSQTQRHVW